MHKKLSESPGKEKITEIVSILVGAVKRSIAEEEKREEEKKKKREEKEHKEREMKAIGVFNFLKMDE